MYSKGTGGNMLQKLQHVKHMYSTSYMFIMVFLCMPIYIHWAFLHCFLRPFGLNKGSTAASPRHNTTRRRLQTTHKWGPQCGGNLNSWRRVGIPFFVVIISIITMSINHDNNHQSSRLSSIITNIIKINRSLEHWVFSKSFLCPTTSACRKVPWIRTRRRFRSRRKSVSCETAVAWWEKKQVQNGGLLSLIFFLWRWLKWMFQNHPTSPKESIIGKQQFT